MPHCQKEKHNHSAKSKKERIQKKEQALARKKAIQEKKLEEELEAKKLSNNIALADGFGEYNVGCDEEKEIKVRFNLNKRKKKHLRNDVRKNQERKEREEEERLQNEKEEQHRMLQEKLRQEETADEEDEIITEEYLVYICQCCQKKFKTTNQFDNHTNSKQHRENASLYEEAGIIVIDVQLRSNDTEDDGYSYEVEDDYCHEEDGLILDEYAHSDDDEVEVEEDEEVVEEEEIKKVGNIFAAFADDSDSSSSSSESSEEDDDDGKDDENIKVSPDKAAEDVIEKSTITESDYEDDMDILEDIIFQNRLNNRLIPDSDNEDGDNTTIDSSKPIPFDDTLYNPDDYTPDENRLLSVQNRLQKRLAARGMEPSQINRISRTTDAVSIGKTLLQQVMEASLDTLQSKLELYNKHKAEHQLLGREFRFAKGNSKALPSQYTFRIDPADNTRRRANIHHASSHYHMQAARSMQFGRTKGLMARHSAQGARLQASRMAAKEIARTQTGGGMKVGKTSKKSIQKRRGEAGGSKKSGGTSTEK